MRYDKSSGLRVTVETVLGVQTMKWSKNEYVRTIGRPFDRPSLFHRLVTAA
jgi:hypothetical protein